MTSITTEDTAARPEAPRTRALPVLSDAYPRRGLDPDELQIVSGFWQRRQETNARTTLDHCLHWIEKLGWLANFDRVAAGCDRDGHVGWPFADSEVYKLMEAIAWEYGRTRRPELDALFRSLSRRVRAAQDEDGYLNTCFGHAGQPARYSDLSGGHELYCAGHLLQAAAARLRTSGQDDFVDAARALADHVCREFGPDGRQTFCGHPEIELGLVEFGRATGEPRYGRQAALFVFRRGHRTLEPPALLGPDYFQDDQPVRQRQAWSGHAVRALYLAAGAVDCAVDSGDQALLEALERQWHRTVERRTYITGGMGSRHQDEGFGEDYELPCDRAYCESCASIASVMVSWRLFLATGRVEYVDLIERTLFNVVAGAVSPEGDRFFYANTLYQRAEGTTVDGVNPRAEASARSAWFDVACCPTNIARTMASLGSYMACVEPGLVTICQYGGATIRTDAGHGPVVLRMETRYPEDGRIRIAVQDAPADGVRLRLRIPAWARDARIDDGSGPREAGPGWADVVAVKGSRLTLDLPMGARVTRPDPRVDATRGCIAVERGPLVLCLEAQDLPAGTGLDDVVVDPASLATSSTGAVIDGSALAHQTGSATTSLGPVPLIPYHQRARRGTTMMRVYLPDKDGGHAQC